MKDNREVCAIRGPLVSVIMPAHNAASTINASVKSVLSQTVQDFELLVGDDASSDSTAEILASINDNRVRLSKNTINLGSGATRDLLLSTATGRWITFCDADDVWECNRLTELLAAVGDDENTIAFDDMMECHSVGLDLVPWRRIRGSDAFGARNSPARVSIVDLIDSDRMLMQPFFSRSQLLSSQACHSRHPFGEDTYFLLKLLTPNSILVYVPKALYLYRLTPGSATTTTNHARNLHEILEISLLDYVDRPLALDALNRKLARVCRDEKYQYLLYAIKNRRIIKVLKTLMQHPLFLLLFLQRSMQDIRYHVNRIRHGGLPRSKR